MTQGRITYRFAVQSVAKHVGISTGSFRSGLNSSDFTRTDGLKSKSGKVHPFFPCLSTKRCFNTAIPSAVCQLQMLVVSSTRSRLILESLDFYPTIVYDGLSIPDVGLIANIIVGFYPKPADTRQISRPDGNEISLVPPALSDMESPLTSSPSVVSTSNPPSPDRTAV